jgi:hypothetical protein
VNDLVNSMRSYVKRCLYNGLTFLTGQIWQYLKVAHALVATTSGIPRFSQCKKEPIASLSESGSAGIGSFDSTQATRQLSPVGILLLLSDIFLTTTPLTAIQFYHLSNFGSRPHNHLWKPY